MSVSDVPGRQQPQKPMAKTGPHQFGHCGLLCASRGALETQERIHTGEKP